ncbi:hypothetical protein ACFVGY_00780 [Streptomyces sp. NPDC127106]|uniref:hypothetical protein n=1 Tax=Streptomyces sp. NPDC127106 TaxID=3345360 RepID=UPI00362CBDE1
MRTRHAFPVRTGIGALFLLLAPALGLAVPTTAHAHGDTLKVVITGQREGHVTTDITWENDGDAIDENVAATVNATSVDGTRTQGPWRLVRGQGVGWSTAEVLPPGTWKVTIDVGFPALGHAEREVDVPVVDPVPPAGSAAPTAPVPVDPSASAAAPSAVPSVAAPAQSPSPAAAPASPSAPAAAGAKSGGDSTVWWTTAGVAVIALAGAAVGVLVRRARARRL